MRSKIAFLLIGYYFVEGTLKSFKPLSKNSVGCFFVFFPLDLDIQRCQHLGQQRPTFDEVTFDLDQYLIWIQGIIRLPPVFSD
jgi:hypothetical protein